MSKTKKLELSEELVELLYQALESELGGVEVYRAALKCVENEDLREEWRKYLEQTLEHVVKLQDLCRKLGIDPDVDTPGRQVVRTIGKSLVQAMMLGLGSDKRGAAERVAAECVVHAETKDHLNWSLLGEFVQQSSDPDELIAEVQGEVEPEEDEHLYHMQGWARELWLKALGLRSQLPPPEEEQEVESAIEAAMAKESRKGA